MTKDPYKYFRIEAGELLDGLKQGALDLEKGEAGKERVAKMLRFAHTLKGAARVVRLPEVAQRAHAIEDVLQPFREGGAVPGERVSEVLGLIDSAVACMAGIGADPSVSQPSTLQATPGAPVVETVRVDLDDMETLLEGVAEATVQVNTLRRESAALDRALRLATEVADQLDRSGASAPRAQRESIGQLRGELAHVHRTVTGSLEQVAAELVQVREAANRLRLAAVSTVFATLERAARDAAHALGKQVAFVARGGKTRLDAHVLAALQDALAHVVRNAVAHGIESPEARAAAGKAALGRVELRVERRTGKVAFSCTDDGRGVDLERLRRAATDRGVLTDRGSPASPDEVMSLMLQGGLTTTASVTQVSGRAIGLDVVREVVARLRGEVRVETGPGQGTTFEIVVPVSLNSLTGLMVRGGGVTGGIPLDKVRETRRVRDSEIARSARGEALLYAGKEIPFVPLARLLRQRTTRRPASTWTVVVVDGGAALAAVGVDQLLGTSELVVRALPAHVEADDVVAGASLDAEGHPELVFDPSGLVQAALGAVRQPEVVRRRLPILVIDDSLTTRMLEQSILESAGYEVELAVSAEEGLQKAARRTYGVFVVDVEMPGMDGFTFVARTRADAVLRQVPAILVTSRGSDEDRRRGAEAGAHAYIVKGEFDQAFLLRTIEELNG